MGEKENKPFQLSFNGLLKVDFQGSRITSDGGLILVRELDERLGLERGGRSRHGLVCGGDDSALVACGGPAEVCAGQPAADHGGRGRQQWIALAAVEVRITAAGG